MYNNMKGFDDSHQRDSIHARPGPAPLSKKRTDS